MSGDSFMEAFVEQTHPHPFTRVLRLRVPAPDAIVVFEVQQLDPKLWHADVRLSFIQTTDPHRGTGMGSLALDWFLRLADAHGCVVVGDVKRVGKTGLKVKGLRDWYRRHGFTVSRDGALRYTPKGTT